MAAEPEGGVVEGLEACGARGGVEGGEEFGGHLADGAGLVGLVEEELARFADVEDPGLDVGGPEGDEGVGVGSEFLEGVGGEGDLAVVVSHGSHEEEAEPVGPALAAGDGEDVAGGVGADGLGGEGLGEEVAGEVGRDSAHGEVPELSLGDAGVVADGPGGVDALGFGKVFLVQAVDVGPEVAHLPDGEGEPGDHGDDDDEAGDAEVEEGPVFFGFGARRGRRVGGDDGEVGEAGHGGGSGRGGSRRFSTIIARTGPEAASPGPRTSWYDGPSKTRSFRSDRHVMKLKRIPEDFQVEELPSVEPTERGRYAFYRLTKRGIGTIEAVEVIRRRWNVASSRLHYGGMKDRHALTIQYLTILEGPMQAIRQENLTLEPVGRLPHAYGPGYFRGNRFSLVLRDLSSQAAERAEKVALEIPTDGLPNYFDDQRFGSVGFDGGFIAEAWLKGDHERAFRLAMAEPNLSDRPGTKQEKAILRETWGDWVEAKKRLPRSHARSLVTYLVDHPTDFRGAFARLKRDLRSIYFSAYQSYLWNLMLGRLIEDSTRPDQRVPIDFKVASLPLHQGLDPDQAKVLSGWKIPLPASRTPLPAEGPERELAESVLGPMGLQWEELKVKHLKDVYFSKGTRNALFFVENLEHGVERDDLYPGRRKMRMGFELPKGAYATLVVKRLTDLG